MLTARRARRSRGSSPDVLRAALAPLRAEDERLRADIAVLRNELERIERSGWRGVWRNQDSPYEAGAVCISDGELWTAVETTSARPGTGAWRRLR